MNNLTHIANEWLNLYSIHMLEISLFILLVWLTDRLVRLNTKLRYLLLMLALGKVFFLPIISLPQTLTETLPVQVLVVPFIETIAVMGASQQSFSFVLILFGLWLFVGLSLAAFIAYKNLAAHYRLRHAKSIDCLKRLAGSVPIHQSGKVKVPVLMGLIRPRLYLPADWQSWSESQVESIIAHEKSHLENRDVWVLSLQYVSLILFWPNPLLWFLHFRLNQVRELRCDESAISQTGMAPVKYSEFLVDCLEKQIKPEPLIIGKYFFKNKKSMMTRINHLLNFKESQMRHQKLFRFGLPLVLVLLMFVFSWRCSRSAALVEPTIQVEAEKNNFIPYDSPPRPMGGFKSIQENLKYPEIARKAGIEGRVFVRYS